MNKSELVSAIHEQSGLTKKVSEEALNAFLQVIQETITANQKVVMVGFGTFEAKEKAARKGMNPRTRETIDIPATTVPVFKAGKELKVRVSGKSPEPHEQQEVPQAVLLQTCRCSGKLGFISRRAEEFPT